MPPTLPTTPNTAPASGTAPDLAGFKKVGAPGSGAPDLSQFKKNVTSRSFRYELPTTAETREAKIAGYQADAAAAKAESDKANSPLGFAANFGKALVSNLFGSEVGLGKTIATELDNTPTKAAANISQLTNAQVSLIKQIRAKEAKGEDTTKLKKIYNSNQDLIDQQHSAISDYAASVPSLGKAAGQLGGTALDILSAGTYGKATAGMKTGQLATGALTRAAAPGAVKSLTPVGKATGLFTAQGAGRVATGAGIGYAADVTQGLQGKRGEDRTGGKAFIPGAGTAIGAAIPAALEGEQSVKNAMQSLSPEGFLEKRTKAFQDLIDRGVKTKGLDSQISDRGRNVSEILAADDAFVPDVNNGVINSDKAINAIEDRTKPMAQIVRAVIESEDKSVPFQQFQDDAINQLDDLKLRGDEYNRVKANVLKDMDFYQANYADAQGNIPLAIIDDIKKAKYGEVNWANPDLYTADRAISRSARGTIENAIPDAPIKAMNDELGKLYDAQEMLETLNGRAVKGGRLGKYFARTIGTAVGAHAGPAGSIAGMLTADKVADLQQSAYFGNPLVQQAIGEIKSSQPEVFAQAQDILAERAAQAANRPLLGLPTAGGSPINQGRVIPVVPSDATGIEPNLMSRDVAVGNYKPPSPPPGGTGTPSPLLGMSEPYTPHDQLPTIDAGATLYRGENASNLGGQHFTTDASWAKNFGDKTVMGKIPPGAKVYNLTEQDMQDALASGITNENDLWNKIFSQGYDVIVGHDAMRSSEPDVIVSPALRAQFDVAGAGPDAASAGIASKSPVEQARFVADTVQKHFKSAKQIIENVPAVDFEKMGGMPELVSRIKTNIADALTHDGLPNVGDAVRTIDTGQTRTLLKFYDQVMTALLGGAAK